ncbi:MAG: HD-GYP domain-containing protein [Lachnospiraceae bacterium]|nr:HD-GYP domain-containing protein [Lachnospiraceae bacterium]
MKKKWKHIKKIFCMESDLDLVPEPGTKKLMTGVIIAVAFLCFGSAFFEFQKKNHWDMLITIAMALVFIACGCLSVWKPRKRMIYRHSSMFALAIVFTIFVLKGYNYGFAPLWAAVIPYTTMAIVGLLEGTVVSAYILLLYMSFFWTPLCNLSCYSYPVEYRIRVPFLYTFCFAISIYCNFKKQEADYRAMMEKERLSVAVEEERRKIGKITMQAIISISNAVDAKDGYTKEHSFRVAEYTKVIAKELRWNKEEQNRIYRMALMHDIGKIGVPDAILNKHGQLTDEEFPLMKMHPLIGGRILKDLTFIEDVSTGAFYHHERYDGKGYPQGLKGMEIPVEARIIGIADSIDAMNSDRVYRGKQNTEYVLEQLELGKGTQFDPDIDEIVIALIKNGKLRLDI